MTVKQCTCVISVAVVKAMIDCRCCQNTIYQQNSKILIKMIKSIIQTSITRVISTGAHNESERSKKLGRSGTLPRI